MLVGSSTRAARTHGARRRIDPALGLLQRLQDGTDADEGRPGRRRSRPCAVHLHVLERDLARLDLLGEVLDVQLALSCRTSTTSRKRLSGPIISTFAIGTSMSILSSGVLAGVAARHGPDDRSLTTSSDGVPGSGDSSSSASASASSRMASSSASACRGSRSLSSAPRSHRSRPPRQRTISPPACAPRRRSRPRLAWR